MSEPTADELVALREEPTGPQLQLSALDRYPDRVGMYLGEQALTYREIRDQFSAYAQAYAALGIGSGTRVALLSPNRPEVLFVQGANGATGCTSTALHPMASVDDHAYVLEDAGMEVLVFDPSFTERAMAVAERVPGLKTLLSFGPVEGATDLLALAAQQTPGPLSAAAVDPEAISGLAYTGGTTGKPKGVQLTWRSNVTMTKIQMAEWQWPDEMRVLVSTPLSHAGASMWTPTLLRGGSMVVLPYFEPEAVFRAIEKYKITTTMVVPTMLYALLDHPKRGDYDLSSLEAIFYGASAISPTRLAEAIEAFGPIFFQFYGQAEAPMCITVLRKEDHDPSVPGRLASCGRPVQWLHVALLDDEGNPVPDGEPGEICVRGPLVMKGYLGKPEQTAEAFEFGWLHTGDVARKEPDGFLTIVDRKKDMIVTGGFNVFPREVEDVLSTHPAVAQAAVIGVPDEKWGEAVKAVVVLRPGASVEPAELIALVKDAKGSVQAPKTVDFAEAIPLSALGKPDKKVLRAQYWGDAARRV